MRCAAAVVAVAISLLGSGGCARRCTAWHLGPEVRCSQLGYSITCVDAQGRPAGGAQHGPVERRSDDE